MAAILLVALLIPLLAVILDSAPARALATRWEGRGPDGAVARGDERLAALEAEVQRLSDQVEVLEEEGRFLRRLLEERPARSGLPPAGPPEEGRGST